MPKYEELHCDKITNGYLNSCTYIVYKNDNPYVWFIDCGDYDEIQRWLSINNKVPKGILLTHCHLDHIYGINKLTRDFPEVKLYLSNNNGRIGIRDCRLNTSKYTPVPYVVETDLIVDLDDNDSVKLYDDKDAVCLKTEGHSPDSMTYIIGKWLFTGDAYIPSFDVITRLPGGNKELATKSVETILSLISEKSLTVMPGHS